MVLAIVLIGGPSCWGPRRTGLHRLQMAPDHRGGNANRGRGHWLAVPWQIQNASLALRQVLGRCATRSVNGKVSRGGYRAPATRSASWTRWARLPGRECRNAGAFVPRSELSG